MREEGGRPRCEPMPHLAGPVAISPDATFFSLRKQGTIRKGYKHYWQCGCVIDTDTETGKLLGLSPCIVHYDVMKFYGITDSPSMVVWMWANNKVLACTTKTFEYATEL